MSGVQNIIPALWHGREGRLGLLYHLTLQSDGRVRALFVAAVLVAKMSLGSSLAESRAFGGETFIRT